MRHPGLLLLLPLLGLAGGRASAADVPESVTGADLRKEHAARRAALAAALPPDSLAVIPAVRDDAGALTAPRQDEDYGWLTGIDETGGVLLLGPPPAAGKPPFECLLLAKRNPVREGWVGPRLFPGPEAEASTGIAATGELEKAAEILAKRLEGVKTVVLPRRGDSAEHAERLFGELVRSRKAKTADLAVLTGPLRLVKSAEELARIRRASVLSAEGHRRAMRAARPGMPEYAVQAVLEEACREGGCVRQAYDSIVGSGPNANVLHYSRNRRLLEEGDLVLVDAAGEYLGYASDVTRTWPVAAAFSEEQGRAYDAVLAAQRAGIAAAKPGGTLKEVDAACRRALEENGYFAKGGVIVPKPGGPAPVSVLPHGCCHWVGRDVHDPNGQADLRPGVVFTIEPGAYFPDKGWGIRIEDTFAMREDGTLECLSKDAPKERAEVEALRAAALAPVAGPSKPEPEPPTPR
jgi:Xaa-Pro aminopeptidase